MHGRVPVSYTHLDVYKRQAQVRRLPVTEGGKLAGILSIDDIARSGRWDMECAQALCGITANICRR